MLEFGFEPDLVPVHTLERGDIIQFDTAIESKVKGIVVHLTHDHDSGKTTITMIEGFSPRSLKDDFDYQLLPVKEVTLIGQIVFSTLGLDSDNY